MLLSQEALVCANDDPQADALAADVARLTERESTLRRQFEKHGAQNASERDRIAEQEANANDMLIRTEADRYAHLQP
jgi:hypothetical protein